MDRANGALIVCRDMQESIFLGDCLQSRLGWGHAKVAPNQRRKDFVQACKQWDELQARQTRGVSASASRPSQQRGDAAAHREEPTKRASLSMPTSPATLTHPSRSYEDPHGVPSRGASSSNSTTPPQPLPPSERVSRIMRVFVAWKAAGPAARRV